MTRLAGATGRPVSKSVPELLYHWSCWLVILGVYLVMGGDVVLLGPRPTNLTLRAYGKESRTRKVRA